jgi:hypothetical protein
MTKEQIFLACCLILAIAAMVLYGNYQDKKRKKAMRKLLDTRPWRVDIHTDPTGTSKIFYMVPPNDPYFLKVWPLKILIIVCPPKDYENVERSVIEVVDVHGKQNTVGFTHEESMELFYKYNEAYNDNSPDKEVRPDCESFELKKYPEQTGDCQTDGHYLCKNCRHIADPDSMEEGDNVHRYYPGHA